MFTVSRLSIRVLAFWPLATRFLLLAFSLNNGQPPVARSQPLICAIFQL
jgi:hypothetical protein